MWGVRGDSPAGLFWRLVRCGVRPKDRCAFGTDWRSYQARREVVVEGHNGTVGSEGIPPLGWFWGDVRREVRPKDRCGLRQIGAVLRRDLWVGWRDIRALCHGSSWRLERGVEGAVATEVVLVRPWLRAATSGSGARHSSPPGHSATERGPGGRPRSDRVSVAAAGVGEGAEKPTAAATAAARHPGS